MSPDEIQSSWYRFDHWSSIDSFIYFGHYTVTIPPPSYIDQAHMNGVKILGTLIFEWDQGAKEARLLLDGQISLDYLYKEDAPDGNHFYAKKLV